MRQLTCNETLSLAYSVMQPMGQLLPKVNENHITYFHVYEIEDAAFAFHHIQGQIEGVHQ